MKQLFSAISLRISLIFTLFTALILLIMGIAIHQLVMQHFAEQDQDLLKGKIALIDNLLQQTPHNPPLLKQQLDDALVGHHGLIVQIERPIGTRIYATLPTPITVPPAPDDRPSILHEWQVAQQPYHVITVQRAATAARDSDRIIVGLDMMEHVHFLDDFRRQLLIIGGIGTFSLMILGWLAAWRGLRPAQSMARVAESITAQHLTSRLDIARAPSELKPLASAFNDMLDRLESTVRRLEDFSSDLAHELRTPINILLNQTQVSLSKTREVSDYQEVLFSNLEEFERLARMIADMLFLAKADNHLALPHLQQIDLAHEISILSEYYEALAADKDMLLTFSGAASMQGDQLMLRRALGNLISNAIRYGKPNSTITTKLVQDTTSILITIQNQADPMSPEQLQRIFDRFYRADSSRKRTDDGSGLGLAITKTIVQVHGGQIEATSDQGLITFSIRFPSTAVRP